MLKLLRNVSMFFWPCLYVLLHRAFWNAGKSVEPTLFAEGHPHQWWAIVFLYWLLDTVVVLASVAIYRWPIDFRQSNRSSFLQVASDLAIAVLFLHLALLTNDQILHERLEAVGLGSLPPFFLAVMFVWLLIGILRYKRLNQVDDTADERISRMKWSAGRRTSILRNPSRGRNRDGPK